MNLKKLGQIFLCVACCGSLEAAQLPVTLNSLTPFGVLGASTVTNSGPSVINGNLGLSPGSAVTGFPPGSVTGVMHITDPTAATAQGDLTTAYNDAATFHRDGDVPTTANGDQGGNTLAPGLYAASSVMSVGIGETLTLAGSANSVWVFQVGTGLTVLGQVILTGGAQASNVFWQVGSSATIGTGATMVGTIMAQASVTLGTGASLAGRAFARTGAVTLLSNSVVQPGPPNISGTPPALSVVCPGNVAYVGVPYSSAAVATGGVSPYTYSITGALPPVLTLNGSTGAVTGTPTTGGPDTFTINAFDSALIPNVANNSCSITTIAGGGGTSSGVPTLSTWGLGLLAILLAGYAVLFSRKTYV